eukprot:Gb_28813 [translate_table: standard]
MCADDAFSTASGSKRIGEEFPSTPTLK